MLCSSLDSSEFLQLLRACNLNLSRSSIRRIMQEADINDDGMIQFEEFVPVMVDIIQSMQALEEASQLKEEEDQEAWEVAQAWILEGMTVEELEEAAQDIFQAYDTDNSGFLERAEFMDCIRAMDMGMTRKEILYIMAQVRNTRSVLGIRLEVRHVDQPLRWLTLCRPTPTLMARFPTKSSCQLLLSSWLQQRMTSWLNGVCCAVAHEPRLNVPSAAAPDRRPRYSQSISSANLKRQTRKGLALRLGS